VWWTGDGVSLEASVEAMVDSGVYDLKPYVHSDCGGDYRGKARPAKHAALFLKHAALFLKHAALFLKHAALFLKHAPLFLKHAPLFLKHAPLFLKHARRLNTRRCGRTHAVRSALSLPAPVGPQAHICAGTGTSAPGLAHLRRDSPTSAPGLAHICAGTAACSHGPVALAAR
jgi:hypothetical protein